jgi:hypothetical protein
MALEDKDRPIDFTPNPEISEAIQAHLQAGKLPCAQAFKIARDLDVAPLTVGLSADAMEVHLTRCQLGLFGYPGHAKGWEAAGVTDRLVPDGIEDAIREAAGESGQLPCATAWGIAQRFSVPRMQVGYLADQVGVQITPCQLGAF